MSVPASLLLQQGPMLKTLAKIAWRSLFDSQRPKANPEQWPRIERVLPPPSDSLIAHYCKWCGASEEQYQQTIPPHLFTQFALPSLLPILEQSRYRLHRVINRGCTMRVFADIPRGQALFVTSEVAEVDDDGYRAKLSCRLTIGYQGQAKAVEVELQLLFLLKRRNKNKQTDSRKSVEALEAVHFKDLGQWSASSNDGWQFGLLTGDLNPIHWIEAVAKRSPLKGKVLHGFGSFVRSFELIQSATGKSIERISASFERPVPLPSEVLLLALDADVEDVTGSQQLGEHQYQLTDVAGNALVAGEVSL
ncbi:MaoC/PaaZ C-terminal domain-containing protein [Corallincola platygyrae]|uniref:MaoC/PaaZ C-terminal domain-containing protein n=1 Tax=Corallincola platygyrae TaxID=1193278 RepID=A0ABW4XH94_9GAMM